MRQSIKFSPSIDGNIYLARQVVFQPSGNHILRHQPMKCLKYAGSWYIVGYEQDGEQYSGLIHSDDMYEPKKQIRCLVDREFDDGHYIHGKVCHKGQIFARDQSTHPFGPALITTTFGHIMLQPGEWEPYYPKPRYSVIDRIRQLYWFLFTKRKTRLLEATDGVQD